jgi:hypothetical protein
MQFRPDFDVFNVRSRQLKAADFNQVLPGELYGCDTNSTEYWNENDPGEDYATKQLHRMCKRARKEE